MKRLERKTTTEGERRRYETICMFCCAKKDLPVLFCRRRWHHGGLLRLDLQKWRMNGLCAKKCGQNAKKKEKKKKGDMGGVAPKYIDNLTVKLFLETLRACRGESWRNVSNSNVIRCSHGHTTK